MTDKLTHVNHTSPMQPILSLQRILIVLIALSIAPLTGYAAEQEWWFDVEVILFERQLTPDAVSEEFEPSPITSHSLQNLDLLTPYLNPDLTYLRAGLPYCRASKRLEQRKQHDQEFAFPLPDESTKQDGFENAEGGNPESIIHSDTREAVLPSIDTAQSDEGSLSEAEAQNEIATEKSTETGTELENLSSQTMAHIENETKNVDAESPPAPLEQEPEVKRPPLKVELIEWQVPSIFPCAYAEQIDPILALSDDPLNHTASRDETSHIRQFIPVEIDGVEWQEKGQPFLLPRTSLRMNKLYEQVNKQRNIKPLLHLGWRQEVTFSKENAQVFRLFAGKNFADNFDQEGNILSEDTDALFEDLIEGNDEVYIPKEELALLSAEEISKIRAKNAVADEDKIALNDTLFTKIEEALLDNSPFDPNKSLATSSEGIVNDKLTSPELKHIWQIEGGIKVYLQRVGQVPYLHIASNLDYRQPILKQSQSLLDNDQGQADNPLNQPLKPNRLQSVNFDQLRRVISKQVHYFDHPLFGMIVRINRYRWPVVEDSTEKSSDN